MFRPVPPLQTHSNSDLLLTYLKASSWFTPHRQGKTSSEEKSSQDREAAKATLSHSTEIRPPLVPSEPPGGRRWLAASRACQVPSLCKDAGSQARYSEEEEYVSDLHPATLGSYVRNRYGWTATSEFRQLTAFARDVLDCKPRGRVRQTAFGALII